MRKILLILFCAFNTSAFAQSYLITFDPGDAVYRSLIFIDTVNYHHNIWQIGKPNKTVFRAAESLPNAIVTDTLHPYPPMDTSVFILKAPGNAFSYSWVTPWLYFMQFSYRLIKDTNTIARMEFSDNHGMYWYNLKDTVPTYWGSSYWHKFTFPDSTSDWDTVSLNNFPSGVDTFLFRFTFISDTSSSGKDGWMIDDIQLFYYWESVNNHTDNNILSVYPNPCKGNIFLHSNAKIPEKVAAVICDLHGREVYATDCLPINSYLSLSLPNGVYVLKYTVASEHFTQRIVIQN